MFLKPIISKYRESQGTPLYYIAKIGDVKKIMSKYGLGGKGDLIFGYPDFLSKKSIDKLPKYLRRGGEYGHDPVIVDNTKETYCISSRQKKYVTRSHLYNLCNIYGLDVILY